MIPKLSPDVALAPNVLAFCRQLASRGFRGEIETSYASRLAVATDNSVYQALPQAVLLPMDMSDIQRITDLANQPDHQQLKFAPRGGGTGTNGQSLTDHVVVDVSRHMRG